MGKSKKSNMTSLKHGASGRKPFVPGINVNRRRPERLEFLVYIEVKWQPDADDELRDRLVAAEAKQARELADAGFIRRLWRIPGRWANWGLWEASDATELHNAISSLPLFRWFSVEVHPLASHPSDPGNR
jgi:muconolactone D-isomerase